MEEQSPPGLTLPRSRERSPFLRLPTECRIEIYKYCLTTSHIIRDEHCQYCRLNTAGRLRCLSSDSHFQFQTALFYVSRTVSQEALHVYYSRNLFVRLTIRAPRGKVDPYLSRIGQVRFSPDPGRLDACKGQALEFEVFAEGFLETKKRSIMPAQTFQSVCLPYLEIRLTDPTWASRHKFRFDLVNAHGYAPKLVRRELLDPLRNLFGFCSVAVATREGLVSVEYAQQLVQYLVERPFCISDWA